MKFKNILIPFIFLTSFAVQADGKEVEVIFISKNLTPEAALMDSQASLESCLKAGLQVSVAVVDGGGNVRAVLRDKLAGISPPDAAILKANHPLTSIRLQQHCLKQSIQIVKHQLTNNFRAF